MNANEECLLLFLKNPGRIDKTTDKLNNLNNFIFSANNNIINMESPAIKATNPINAKMYR